MSLSEDQRSTLAEHTRWLRRRARHLVASDDLARDLVQDTIEAYLRRPPALKHSLRAWLDGALKNQFRMWSRSEGRRKRRENAAEKPDGPSAPDRRADRVRWLELVEAALCDLPEVYASTLRLRYLEGLQPVEIATRLGLPPSTVRRRNLVGLGLLRQNLETRLGHTLDERHGPLWAMLPLPPTAGGARLRNVGGRGYGAAMVAVVALTAGGALWMRPRADSAVSTAQVAGGAHESIAGPAPLASHESGPPAAARAQRERAQADADWSVPAGGCGTLEARVAAARPGAALHLPACVFREHVVIDKPIALVGQPGTEIRGSEVWSEWERIGALWRSRGSVPDDARLHCAPTARGENSDDRICWPFEQVFFDGERLWPRPGGRPEATEFSLDSERRVVIARAPQGHIVEVSERLRWLTIASSNVAITGMTFRHALVGTEGGAVVTANGVRDLAFAGNSFHAAGAHAMVLAADGLDIRGNHFGQSGGAALMLNGPGHARIIGNTFDSNGRGHRRDNGWVVAGVKAIHARVHMEHNTFLNSAGVGAFLIESDDATVTQNRFDTNAGAALIAIRSRNARITENAFVRNGWGFTPPHPGVWITESHAVTTAANKFAFHARAIEVDVLRSEEVPAGFDPCRASGANRIEDNLAFASGRLPVMVTGDPRARAQLAPCESNRVENNRVWGLGPLAHAGLAPMADDERLSMLHALGLSAAAP